MELKEQLDRFIIARKRYLEEVKNLKEQGIGVSGYPDQQEVYIYMGIEKIGLIPDAEISYIPRENDHLYNIRIFVKIEDVTYTEFGKAVFD
jgi:hypothetical protein